VLKVKEKARKLCGGDIFFTGHRDDLTDIYRELDAAVCPSLTENLGAAAESLAAGVPTVATSVGGFPDIVKDGVTGRLAKPRSPESLAEAILSLLKDRQSAQTMADSGRELVTELLSLERCCGEVYKMYRTILGEEDYHPLVSIIIPVFNGGEYLSQAIDSALAQSYKNIEVLVINDGSTDGGATRECALSYGGRILYFEKENGGVSSALNEGIRCMRGEWFSWLSHDDLYHPDKIKRQVDYLRALSHNGRDEDLSYVILHGHTQLIDKKGRTIFRMKSYIDSESRLLVLNGIRQNRLNGCSFLLHRSCFERFGMFEESIRTVSDYDMWYRLLFGGCSFHCLPDYMVKTRVHARQVTHTRRRLSREEMERFHSGIVKRFYESGMYNSARDFYKLGGYLLRKGQHSCADDAFDAARTLHPSPLHNLRKAAVICGCAVFYHAWTLIKKIAYTLLLK
jgi:glycosyltransferase involved in cell wall biosynthesis